MFFLPWATIGNLCQISFRFNGLLAKFGWDYYFQKDDICIIVACHNQMTNQLWNSIYFLRMQCLMKILTWPTITLKRPLPSNGHVSSSHLFMGRVTNPLESPSLYRKRLVHSLSPTDGNMNGVRGSEMQKDRGSYHGLVFSASVGKP